MIIWIATLSFLVLLLTVLIALREFGILSRFGGPAAPRRRPVIGRIWDALHPDFVGFDTDRATTQTLTLLVAAMWVFGAAIALWAAGAGAMRTAWLYAVQPDGVSKGLTAGWSLTTDPVHWQAWVVFICVLLFQLLRAVGGVMVIGLAAGLVGATLGFVFGIPRPISASEAPPAEAGGEGRPALVSARHANKAWELSTNLTQISDWLTKIIVGVSLVEAKNAWAEFQNIAIAAAGSLFDMRHGSAALIASAMVGSAVFGFLFAYLYTELIIARLIAAVDRGLAGPSADAHRRLRDIPLTEGLAPRISRSRSTPEPTDSPSAEEVEAALQYHAVSFDELVSRADVSPEEILNWSRAKAVLNDYRAAAQGYIYLLGLLSGMGRP